MQNNLLPTLEESVSANRIAWEAAVPYHRNSQDERINRRINTNAYLDFLEPASIAILTKKGVQGKRVVQLCANNGRETMAIASMGASRAVGVDISQGFVDHGRELAKRSGLPLEMVCCSVYEIPAEFQNSFDLSYISIGALGWMPDLARFFKVARSLLVEGGSMIIHEKHPLSGLFNGEEEGVVFAPLIRNSYFRTEPFIESDSLDYYEGTEYDAPPQHWYHHRLDQIFTCALSAGFTIESFTEYEEDISNEFSSYSTLPCRLPYSYLLSLNC